MKNIFPLALLILALFSCKNDIEINADYKDITVVYGLLDPNADTNFIRIERGFLSEDAAANHFNQPDSFYYDTTAIHVKINWYNISGNGSRGNLADSAKLIPDFTSRKLSNNGPFDIASGHYVYRIPNTVPINSNYEYELIITKENGEPNVSASTRVLPNFKYKTPRNVPNMSTPIYFAGSIDFSVSGDEEDLKYFQSSVYFTYRELNLQNKTEDTITLKYDFPDNTTNGSMSISRGEFFNYLANRITDNNNVLRFFHSMELETWAADENLTTYIKLNEPSTGIAQNKPEYTNIENGTGIFASRIQVTLDKVFLNENGTSPTWSESLYRNENICSKRFAYTNTVGDTCICNPNPAASNQALCPYN